MRVCRPGHHSWWERFLGPAECAPTDGEHSHKQGSGPRRGFPRELNDDNPEGEHVIKRFPKSAPFHPTLANLSFRMGDRERAVELAKRCLKLDPDSTVYQSALQRFTSEDGEAAQP